MKQSSLSPLRRGSCGLGVTLSDHRCLRMLLLSRLWVSLQEWIDTGTWLAWRREKCPSVRRSSRTFCQKWDHTMQVGESTWFLTISACIIWLWSESMRRHWTSNSSFYQCTAAGTTPQNMCGSTRRGTSHRTAWGKPTIRTMVGWEKQYWKRSESLQRPSWRHGSGSASQLCRGGWIDSQ